jgi:hypothetical protein
MSVTPFVAYADRKFVFTSSAEVAEVFWAPLSELELETVDVEVGRTEIRGVRAYVHGRHVIWGLTAQILDCFFALL